jgi:hypothetical protein
MKLACLIVIFSASTAVADSTPHRHGLTMDVAAGIGPLHVRENGDSISDLSGTRYSLGAGWFVNPRIAINARFVTHDLYRETAPSTMDIYPVRFVSRSSIGLGAEAQIWPWRELAIAAGLEVSSFGTGNLRGKTATGVGGTLRAAYAVFQPSIYGTHHAVQLRVETSIDRYAGDGLVIGSAILLGWQVL